MRYDGTLVCRVGWALSERRNLIQLANALRHVIGYHSSFSRNIKGLRKEEW